MVEREARLIQEVARLRGEPDLIDAQILSLAHMRPQRYTSRFPLDYQGQTLFHNPDQSTPPGFTPPDNRLPHHPKISSIPLLTTSITPWLTSWRQPVSSSTRQFMETLQQIVPPN